MTTASSPYDWLLVGHGVVVFSQTIAFDDGAMLSMAITLDTGTSSAGNEGYLAS